MTRPSSALAAPFALALFCALPANAAEPAASQTLFNEAKSQIAKGNWAAACPKLEESQRLDPAIGTQFNLADCYEHTGRTASAWALFLEVAAETKEANQPAREKASRERAAALEPKLSRLIINVTSADDGRSATQPGQHLDGRSAAQPGQHLEAAVDVKRDGVVVGRAQWGSALPVDPGSHVVAASAPGAKTWQTNVAVQGEGTAVTVVVPELEPAPASTSTATPTSTSTSTPTSTSNGPGAAVLVLGGVGLAAIAVGATFGVFSLVAHGDGAKHCNGDTCDAVGVSMRDDAIHAGNVSTVAFGIGAAALVGAGVLWLTAPSAKKETSSPATARTSFGAAPWVGANAGGVTMKGTW